MNKLTYERLEAHRNQLRKILREIVSDSSLRELMMEPDCNDCGSTLARARKALRTPRQPQKV